jgi:hypothetical protein
MTALAHRAKILAVSAGLFAGGAALALPSEAAACRMATTTSATSPDLPPLPPTDPFGYSGCVDEQFGHWWRAMGYWQDDVKAWAEGKIPPS